MKEKKINIGVLGCADIALRSVLPAIIGLPDLFDLKGIASRDKNKADNCAQKFQTNPFYSYDNLIENENIDAIYIPLPNALHAVYIEKALNRGIHILVEKSLGCSLNEVQVLNRLAKKNNCVLIENFQFRFHPQMKVIIDLLQIGTIGELRSMRSSFGFPPFANKDNIRYNKSLGGGALLDAGAYPIKISQIFLGYDLEVKGASLKMDDKSEVDIWGGGFLKQKEGQLFSEIAFGFDHFYQCNLELWGSKGKLTTNRIFTAPANHEVEIILENNKGKEIIKVLAANHFKNMLNYFGKAIRSGRVHESEYFQNINQARLIEEFKYKS